MSLAIDSQPRKSTVTTSFSHHYRGSSVNYLLALSTSVHTVLWKMSVIKKMQLMAMLILTLMLKLQ
jgi:hypothetical protein